jgi:hypothetical protein
MRLIGGGWSKKIDNKMLEYFDRGMGGGGNFVHDDSDGGK